MATRAASEEGSVSQRQTAAVAADREARRRSAGRKQTGDRGADRVEDSAVGIGAQTPKRERRVQRRLSGAIERAEGPASQRLHLLFCLVEYRFAACCGVSVVERERVQECLEEPELCRISSHCLGNRREVGVEAIDRLVQLLVSEAIHGLGKFSGNRRVAIGVKTFEGVL